MSKIKSEFILPRVKLHPDGHHKATVVNVEESNSEKNGVLNQLSSSEMVRIARAQFNAGRTKSVEFRRQQLKNLLKMFDENTSAFEEALVKDLRRPKLEASVYDVEYSRNQVKYMLMHLDEWSKPEHPPKPLANLFEELSVRSEPFGVVLVIAPWNFPFNLLFGPACGAIAAGNCVILKPSEISSACAKIVAQLVPKYLDKDCYHVYLGGVAETAELLEQRFDHIFFTGSTVVGKIVHAAANKYITPVTLELGGKSPVFLDDTVDIEVATKRILWGKCINAGQICIAPDYLLCTKKVQEKFIETAKKQLQEWYKGDAKNSPDYSRIISNKHFERLAGFLNNKQNIAVGGRTDASQLFIEPTILVNVSPNEPVMLEEIFGPIFPIILVKNASEAVSFINARERPLALYIFSNDRQTKDLILNNTISGGVAINDVVMHFSVDSLPFGGVGYSGMGFYHGRASFDTFVHKRSVLEKSCGRLYEKIYFMRYPPYSDRHTELINAAIRVRKQLPVSFLKYFTVFLLGIAITLLFQYAAIKLK